MIFVISPAKALDFETPSTTTTFTQCDFLSEASELIDVLRQRSPADISALMHLSDQLAALNVARYESWKLPFDPTNAKQAVLAFNGDVYGGLDAKTLGQADLEWAQAHLRILSGLYGILRPLDLIQPYRLEMGTALANPGGSNLYAFWGDKLTLKLNELIAAEQDAGGPGVLVNLASGEYFKSVKAQKLCGPVVTPVFEDWKGGRYKVVSFFAKRARGLMSRYAIQNRVEDVEDLKSFDREGYSFASEASDDATLVFRRRAD